MPWKGPEARRSLAHLQDKTKGQKRLDMADLEAKGGERPEE